MDEWNCSTDLISTSKHRRVIVHIDVDCFYAQVEMLKNPALKNQPLGIKQKNIVVTSNYIAREFGIKKCMLVTDALKLCPDLVLVSGEDLHDYRQMSSKITSLLQKFSPLVEKLGLDENYVDVTQAVQETLEEDDGKQESAIVGHTYENDTAHSCPCGCYARLCRGSHIASKMRLAIQEELNVTTCAGISHNKLLAKLVGSTYKPNQQTTLLPSGIPLLLCSLDSVRSLPGIGHSMSRLLRCHNIISTSDLQNSTLANLQQFLDQDTALRFKSLCFGIDDLPVKPSGKPLSLGLEDGFRKISLESEVRDKFSILLQRLLKLLAEDGRVPRSVKVTVRKYDAISKQSHKETRQCNISPSLFPPQMKGPTTPTNIHKILVCIMQLFLKIVDISKPFHLTLLGVAFAKFQERVLGRSSIAAFLQKDVSVQAITSIKSEMMTDASKMELSPVSLAAFRTPTSRFSSNNSGSESEVEPSPKKICKDFWVNKRKRLMDDTEDDSPNKLRVSELQLSSPVTSRGKGELNRCISSPQLSSPVQSQSLDHVFVDCGSSMELPSSSSACLDVPMNFEQVSKAIYSSDTFECPANIDQTVFKELPPDMQEELRMEWRSEKILATKHDSSKSLLVKPSAKQNSLLKYFISNK